MLAVIALHSAEQSATVNIPTVNTNAKWKLTWSTVVDALLIPHAMNITLIEVLRHSLELVVIGYIQEVSLQGHYSGCHSPLNDSEPL